MVNRSRRRPQVKISGCGTGIMNHAGALLVADLAGKVGLTASHVAQNNKNRRSANRWSHHPTCRSRRVLADPLTGRGTLRLDQNRRPWPQAQIPRPGPEPGLDQNGSRRLQPDQNLFPRRSRNHL